MQQEAKGFYGEKPNQQEKPITSQSLLPGISNEFYNYLNAQHACICRIQDRLHLIVNKLSPSKMENDTQSDENKEDIITELRKRISKLMDNNEMLAKIESHLSEII